ncbi:hypothetical protein [Virgisporangium aurantiacum]|uniref:Uncharacterized protein n=1 Tax=Virgisporangium aurantiacum TaxID=175570 RepID=A0A8J3ZIQ3_9ACTN|nr:hypothetical protein [Virgisporangium aurantiacum]GIJ63513.1 hypothetical protein Vau01_110290 [Virgisporangium aurantiacum]
MVEGGRPGGRPYSVELQLTVDDAGGDLGELAYRWLDEVSMARASAARAQVAPLPARIAQGPLGEPGDVFGFLSMSRPIPGRRLRGQYRHASEAGMRWVRQELRDVPRSVHLWFGNLDYRGNRAGSLCSAKVDRHDTAPNRVVLTSTVSEADLTDPLDGAQAQRLYLDLMFRFADQANPAYGHIAYHDHGRTAFEAGLRNIDNPAPPQWWSYPRTLEVCREALRGYSWLTILPQELLDRVGGLDTLAGSGAFVEVRPLHAGGVWLLATDDYRTFDDAALLRVFHALAPALRPGPVTLWPPSPGEPALRVVPKNAGRYPLGHDRTPPDRDPSTPFWWTVTVDNPNPADVCIQRVTNAELVSIGAVEPIETAYWRMPLVAEVVLPKDADPGEAAEVLADAVGRAMHAAIAYTPAIPEGAAEPRLVDSPLEPPPGHQIAVYFARLLVESKTKPEPAKVFAHLDIAWSHAWKRRYSRTGHQRPVFVPTTMDRFNLGYAATNIHRTSLEDGASRI